MDEDEEFLVPQNSFSDERDLSTAGDNNSRRTTQPSVATTTSGGWYLTRDRKEFIHGTPPQSLRSSITERPSPTKIEKQTSESSLSANGSLPSPKLSPKQKYDMEMLRSGHSIMYELQSRLHQQANDSEVFKTLSYVSKRPCAYKVHTDLSKFSAVAGRAGQKAGKT